MPIRYTCSSCSQRLSISRKKAGEEVACPTCGALTRVPFEDEVAGDENGIESRPESTGVVFSEWSNPSANAEETSERDPGWEELTERAVDSSAAPEERAEVVESRAPESPIETPSARVLSRDIREADDADGDEEPTFQIRKPQTDFEEMDLTPMVDVTFLLLIFFMLTASFSLQKTIPTPVPEQNEQSASQPIQQEEDLLEKSILIEIDSNNRIFLDEELVADARGLEEALREKINREQKNEVLVDASGEAFNVTVVEVLDAAREVGMQRIRMSFPRSAEAGD